MSAAVSMSLTLLVETESNNAQAAHHPQIEKLQLQRNGTVSSAVSTTEGSSSASRTNSECSSDAEDFPALPSLAARPKAAGSSSMKPKSSVWFSGATSAKVMKPTAATASATSSPELNDPCAPAGSSELAAAASDPTPPPQAKIPELRFEYPVGMVVRNTFLDFNLDGADAASPRLRRRARSAEPRRSRMPTDEEESDFFRPFKGLSSAAVEAADADCEGMEVLSRDQSTATVLELVSALPLPALGSAACPTEGSASHGSGQCKPCAFFWKARGCDNGVECPFCHLCDANEKKRRQKEKKASFQFTESFCNRLLTAYTSVA